MTSWQKICNCGRLKKDSQCGKVPEIYYTIKLYMYGFFSADFIADKESEHEVQEEVEILKGK